MTKDDKAIEAAEAAMKAGQPSLAGAILAADVLGMDIKGPHILEAASHASTMIEWGLEPDERRGWRGRSKGARRG